METLNYVYVSIKAHKTMFKILANVSKLNNANYVDLCLLQQHANFYTISLHIKVLNNKYKIVY